MAADNDLPQRRRPVHPPPVSAFNRSTILHVTVCVKNRQPVLANNHAHEALLAAWKQARHWLVGCYVILPDHVHLFCAPADLQPEPVEVWVAYWKRLAAKGIRSQVPDFQWQRDLWDTQLRRHESYSSKWDYVRRNAVRHGLIDQPEKWPYQGVVHELPWHD